MKKNEEFQKQNPYQSDKLAKIPSWIKILLLKYWAAAAAFYFFAVANPIAQNEDQYYVWVSFGLGIFLEYIVKTLVRFMKNSTDNTYRFNLINLKGVVSLLLNLVYSFVIVIPIMAITVLLQQHGISINLFGEYAVGIEPLMDGLIFLLIDAIAVLIKKLIIKGIKKYKFYKQEKKAQAIIGAANIKKEEEDK